MKVPISAINGSVRFSFSRYNTEQEVDRIIEVFPQVVADIRRMSPFWDQKNNVPRSSAEKLFSPLKG
jgi:cysteine desulfurase